LGQAVAPRPFLRIRVRQLTRLNSADQHQATHAIRICRQISHRETGAHRMAEQNELGLPERRPQFVEVLHHPGDSDGGVGASGAE
jgi:hypothetical protein